MKIIKVMFAASDELREEQLEFTDLLSYMNRVFSARGIELKLVKWVLDSSTDFLQYKDILENCEFCLNLYWQKISKESINQLDFAYENLCNGNNPHNLYVFFKEPELHISDILHDFKANFVTQYGHFYCKFTNVDTIKVNFLMQFESYHSELTKSLINDDIIQIEKGLIKINNNVVANFDNLPFAFLNKEYMAMKEELSDLEEKLSNLRMQYVQAPENNDLFSEMIEIGSKKKEKTDEMQQYQLQLYKLASNFVQQAGKEYSDRMARAREQFERGNIVEADNIMNLEELKEETKQEKIQLEQHINNLEIKIDEFLLKVDTVMSNSELNSQQRFDIACESYECAIDIAEMINYAPEKMSDIFFHYAVMLDKYEKLDEAEKYYDKAIDIENILIEDNELHIGVYTKILNNLALLHRTMNKYQLAELEYQEAVECSKYMLDSPIFDSYEASNLLSTSLNGLAALHYEIGNFELAEKEYTYSLSIRLKFIDNSIEYNLSRIAKILSNVAVLHEKLQKYDLAEKEYGLALAIDCKLTESNRSKHIKDLAFHMKNMAIFHSNRCRDNSSYIDLAEQEYENVLRIYRELVDENPIIYVSYLANTLVNFASFYEKQKREKLKVSDMYSHALTLYRKLSDKNPQKYLPDLSSTLYSFAGFHSDNGQTDLAEGEYLESLTIRKKLAKDNPDVFLPKLSNTLHNLAIFYDNNKQFELAKEKYIAALEIRWKLAYNNPNVYMKRVYNTLVNLADADDYPMSNIEKKCAYLINNYKDITDYENIAPSLLELANGHRDINRVVLAETEYEILIQICESLSSSNIIKDNENFLASVLMNLSILYERNNQYDAAEKNYCKAIDIRRKLVNDNPRDNLSSLADLLSSVACLHQKKGQYIYSEVEYTEAYNLRKQIYNKCPLEDSLWGFYGDYLNLCKIAKIAESLADLYEEIGNKLKAEQMLMESISIYEKLVDKRIDFSADLEEIKQKLIKLRNS